MGRRGDTKRLLALAVVMVLGLGLFTGCREKISNEKAWSRYLSKHIARKYGDKPEMEEMGQDWDGGYPMSRHRGTWARTQEGYYIYVAVNGWNVVDTRQSKLVDSELAAHFAADAPGETMLLYDYLGAFPDEKPYIYILRDAYNLRYEPGEDVLDYLAREQEARSREKTYVLYVRNNGRISPEDFFAWVDGLRESFPMQLDVALLEAETYDSLVRARQEGDRGVLQNLFRRSLSRNSFDFEEALCWTYMDFQRDEDGRAIVEAPDVPAYVVNNTLELQPGITVSLLDGNNRMFTAGDFTLEWIETASLGTLHDKPAASGYFWAYNPMEMALKVTLAPDFAMDTTRLLIRLEPALFGDGAEEKALVSPGYNTDVDAYVWNTVSDAWAEDRSWVDGKFGNYSRYAENTWIFTFASHSSYKPEAESTGPAESLPEDGMAEETSLPEEKQADGQEIGEPASGL